MTRRLPSVQTVRCWAATACQWPNSVAVHTKSLRGDDDCCCDRTPGRRWWSIIITSRRLNGASPLTNKATTNKATKRRASQQQQQKDNRSSPLAVLHWWRKPLATTNKIARKKRTEKMNPKKSIFGWKHSPAVLDDVEDATCFTVTLFFLSLLFFFPTSTFP